MFVFKGGVWKKTITKANKCILRRWRRWRWRKKNCSWLFFERSFCTFCYVYINKLVFILHTHFAYIQHCYYTTKWASYLSIREKFIIIILSNLRPWPTWQQQNKHASKWTCKILFRCSIDSKLSNTFTKKWRHQQWVRKTQFSFTFLCCHLFG